MIAPNMFFAGGECLTRHGVLVRRTSPTEALAPETFTRSGAIGNFVDRNGVIRGAEANVPRVEWISGVPYLLVEAAAANLCLQSEVLATTWVNTRSSDSANTTTAPDGNTTADTLIEDSTASSTHYIGQSITKAASSLKYAASLYVKAKERSGIVLRITNASRADGVQTVVPDITGAVGAAAAFGSGWAAGVAGIERLASTDWYRIFVTGTSDTNTTIIIEVQLHNGSSPSYSGDGASGLYLWGMQLEQAAAPSSYIPTTTVAVTRNADTFYGDFLHRGKAMTVYAKFIERGTNLITNGGIFHIGGTSAIQGPRLTVTHSGSGFYALVYNNGTDANVIATLATAPSIGESVELLCVLNADGSTKLSQSIDSGAQANATGSPTPALGIVSPWKDLRMYIGSSGTTQRGMNWIAAIKVNTGIQTMNQMRAM